MPHDRGGKLLEVGDTVLIPCKVKDVSAGEEYCNCTVVTETAMPPYTEPMSIALNTKQVVKVTPGYVIPSE